LFTGTCLNRSVNNIGLAGVVVNPPFLTNNKRLKRLNEQKACAAMNRVYIANVRGAGPIDLMKGWREWNELLFL
jgi:hypothetical protein